jgi:DNA-binding MarR family transcriptional regulator
VEPPSTRREAQIEETLGLMRGAFTRALAGRGVGPGREAFPMLQHFALHFVMNDHAGITQTELASLLGVSPGYVTTLVDRLEQDRLVKRTRDRKDRRVVRLRATLRGLHFHHTLHRQFNIAAVPLFEGWTDEEIGTFQNLLRKLANPPVSGSAGAPELPDPDLSTADPRHGSDHPDPRGSRASPR